MVSVFLGRIHLIAISYCDLGFLKTAVLLVGGIKVSLVIKNLIQKLKINKYFIWINMHYIEPYIDLF